MIPKPNDSTFDEADRTTTNDNGQTYFGYDDEETGTTDWYDSDGGLDSTTYIPVDDED